MNEQGGLSKRQLKWILAAILITLVVIVAMQNWQEVTIEILFVDVQLSLFLLIITTFVAGAFFGWMTRKRRRG